MKKATTKLFAFIFSMILLILLCSGIAVAEYPSIDLYVSQTEAVLGDTIQISYTVNNPYETEYIMFEVTEYWGNMSHICREHSFWGQDPTSLSYEYNVTSPCIDKVIVEVSHQTGSQIIAYESEVIIINQPSGPVPVPEFTITQKTDKVVPGSAYSADITVKNVTGLDASFWLCIDYSAVAVPADASFNEYNCQKRVDEVRPVPEDGTYHFQLTIPKVMEDGQGWQSYLRPEIPMTVNFELDVGPWSFGSYRYIEFMSQEEIDRERKDKTQAFVTRCYNLIMNREAESGGLNYWTGQLTEKTSTASAIIDQFTKSDEFKGRKLSSAAKVDILYNTMLARDPDSAGKAYWVSQLDAGVSESAIINGFCGSEEFAAICADYDIEPGTVAADQPDQPAAEGVQGFVQRCYTKALDRGFDQDGVNYWVEEMQKGLAPQEVAKKFIFSEEAINKGRNNDEFIKTLYRLYMGREADEAGLAYWNEKMAGGMSREQVNDGFAGSEEFAAIVAGFGL